MTGSFRATLDLRRLLLLPVFAAIALAAVGPATAGTPWSMGGQNIQNTRSTSSTITSATVGNLSTKWTFTTAGDVSATPAVVGNAVYFPDWGAFVNGFTTGGYLYKLNATTGALIWSHKISEYTGIANSVSRTSPVVVGNTVYLGDQNGAHLLAVNATTGALQWMTTLGTRPDNVITQSPVVFGGVVYVGVTSLEEGNIAFIPNAPCCSARGYFNAVNATTGTLLWQTYMTPPGYSGAGVWGSTPAIDAATRTVYITTGNNYSIPPAAAHCKNDLHLPPEQCLDPTNHYDSFVALNMDTGEIRWSSIREGYDDWNVACIFSFFNPLACPVNSGPDYDFGAGPNLFTIQSNGKPRKVIGAGQKSGQYWLLDATTGDVIWMAQPAPGSTLGGMEWGTATDGNRIYFAETNYGHKDTLLPNGQKTSGGSFGALDAKTGAILWQIEDPGAPADPFHGFPLAAPTVANGVVYVGSMTGDMFALDASDGDVLWKYRGQGGSNSGPAVSDGTVYWGNGYNHLGIPEGSPSTTFYAFSVNGN